MIIGFAIALALVIVLLQLLLPALQQKHLVFGYDYNKTLVEPEQKITLTSTVRNTSGLPVMYVGMSQFFPDDITLVEDPQYLDARVTRRFGEYSTKYNLFLPPHRQFTAQIHFALPKRGVYTLGKYYVENGDYLGLRCQIQSGELKKRIVVMPAKSENFEAIQALGGYIGDISVRRFILEDPILTVGCRDYTGHEPMKSIAWVQTARTGRMLVKQYDHTVEASATVLLNLEGGSEEDREECLRLTRSTCEELEKNRISYDFYTNGDLYLPQRTLSWQAQGLGKQHFNTVMYGLGTSHCRNLTAFSDLAERCLKSRRPKNGYILITPPLAAGREEILRKLRRFSDYDVLVLTGKGGGAE